MPQKAPFGTWKSPITADILTQKAINISDVFVDSAPGPNGESTIYHTEARPFEGGRVVPVLSKEGKDVLGEKGDVRTGIHEYGGSCTAVRDGVLYFSDGKSRRLFRSDSPGAEPVAVSPDTDKFRFGDFIIHPTHPHLIISILEDHTKPSPADVVNKLVVLNTQSSTITDLITGADFYAMPTLTPDGSRLAFVRWDHPNMPWDATELCVVDLATPKESTIELNGKITVVAGSKGPKEECATQPVWLSNDTLVYYTDVSDFWNPWSFDASDGSNAPVLPKPLEADFADPAWSLGDTKLAALDEQTLVVAPLIKGRTVLSVLDVKTGKLRAVEGSGYVAINRIRRVSGTQVVFVGVKDTEASSLVLFSLSPSSLSSADESTTVSGTFTILKTTSDLPAQFPSGLFAPDVPLELPTPDGEVLHVMLALPKNPEYESVEGEKPPCVVQAHGGPTGRSEPGLAWLTQYFTSRGWAFCSVNYGGSSGFGRAYRDKLKGQFGVVDEQDCSLAVRLLGAQGLIDPKRVVIRGRSAGGYTVLQALVNSPDVWAAGANSFGISDLRVLVGETHKFESQYCTKLVGGTLEEIPEVYHARSPINFAEKITAPLLILQGSEDHVVPPNQSSGMRDKILSRPGAKCKYILFDGEGHGWRKAENVKRSMEEELGWYEEVLGLGVGAA